MTKRQRKSALADFLPIRRKNAPVPCCRFSAIDPKSRALCSIALTFRSKCLSRARQQRRGRTLLCHSPASERRAIGLNVYDMRPKGRSSPGSIASEVLPCWLLERYVGYSIKEIGELKFSHGS